MTEQELIDLRDSLVTMNSGLDALDSRVTALEALSVPKGTYFESIKAAFESSPECCDCTSAVVECGCADAISSVYLKTDGDDITYANAVYTINGETVDDLSAFIASEATSPIYVFFAATEEYIETIHLFKFVNVTSEDLCIEITVNNPFIPLKQVRIPDEELGDGHVYKTSFNFWGDDADYVTLNNSFQVISNTAELGKIKFCLKGN